MTEEQRISHIKAVRKHEQGNYNTHIVFPTGTRERIESLQLEYSNSMFIKMAVEEKLRSLGV